MSVRSFSPLQFLQTHAPRLISAGLVSNGMRGPLLAALLAFLVGLPCAMILPPLDRDESRFVQASAQMMESHDYIDINFQNEPRYKKPVGIHWLQVAAVKLTSSVAKHDILPYRLPSLFGAALAAFACAWGASKAFGTRVGTKAGLLFAVSFMLSTEAFWAKTDAVQCGLITLMMAALAQIYLRTRDLDIDAPKPKMLRLKLIFWLALAGSIMIKIIIGPMVLAGALVTLFLWDRKVRWAKHLSWGWGLILVLAICGPWFVAITITTDGQFWVGAVGHDFASKLNGGCEGHFMWPGYHTLLLPATLFPMAWLLGGGLQTAIARRHEAAIRFAIAWFLPAFIIFELSPTKLPHYPLPAFGAVAWLCAVAMDVPLKLWAKILNVVLGVIGGLILTVIAVAAWQQLGTPGALIYVVAVGAAALAVAVFAGWLFWQRHPRSAFGFLLAAGIVSHLGLVSLVASLKPMWVSQNMAQALTNAHLDPRQGLSPGPVAVLGYAEPSFVFAMGTQTQLLNDDAKGAVAALSGGQPLFVESRYEAPFQAAAKSVGVVPHVVSVTKGRNYSNGRNVVLTLYDNPQPVDGQ